MRLSRDVLRETERVLRRFGEDTVASLAILLDRARFATTMEAADVGPLLGPPDLRFTVVTPATCLDAVCERMRDAAEAES